MVHILNFLIMEEHPPKEFEEPPSKVFASIFKSEEECSAEEKKFVTDSKEVARKMPLTLPVI